MLCLVQTALEKRTGSGVVNQIGRKSFNRFKRFFGASVQPGQRIQEPSAVRMLRRFEELVNGSKLHNLSLIHI